MVDIKQQPMRSSAWKTSRDEDGSSCTLAVALFRLIAGVQIEMQCKPRRDKQSGEVSLQSLRGNSALNINCADWTGLEVLTGFVIYHEEIF